MYLSTCVIKIIGKYNHDYAYAKCEMSYAIKCITQKNPGRPPECWAFEARSRFALGRSNSTFSCTCQNLIIRLDIVFGIFATCTNYSFAHNLSSLVFTLSHALTLSRSLPLFFLQRWCRFVANMQWVFIPLLIYNFFNVLRAWRCSLPKTETM